MPRTVVSASRRTDIPAFYMPWFMECIRRGVFDITNPYNRHVSHVSADAGQVHSIVFWSKNFGPFLDGRYGERLLDLGYRLFFNFTVNSPDAYLEPGVAPLSQRLGQLGELAKRFGPRCIHWRFDPICCYKAPDGRIADNCGHFETIADAASRSGIRTCITSFVDIYRKVERRMRACAGPVLVDPPLQEKADRIRKMAAILVQRGISLHLCCEKSLLDHLPPDAGVQAAACIPSRLLADLYGPDISLQSDPGQRAAAGCGCGVSRDIGSYDRHPCPHNCSFCYANPAADAARGAA